MIAYQSFKKQLSVYLPLILLLLIIIGLYFLGSSRAKQYQYLQESGQFKQTLNIALDKAKHLAGKYQTDIDICPMQSKVQNQCGTKNDWIYGLLLFKDTKQTDASSLKDQQIVHNYPLKLSSQVITEHKILDMQPNGQLKEQYTFTIKFKNRNLFPYQITVYKDLTLEVQLMSEE